MFFMLMLVLGANYLLLFVGWEGVGLCSYLLIGFYFDKKFATDAGNKAFIVNRIGDFGFSLAMFLIFRNFGSLDFAEVFHKAPGAHGTDADHDRPAADGGRLREIGADSPVRLAARRDGRPHAGLRADPRRHHGHRGRLHDRPLLGDLHPCSGRHGRDRDHRRGHRLLAATIGLVQNDIKKVFAYSTVSQLGYMFLGIGSGAFSAGIYHLVTHAFFKALLFLGAGSVIHALSGEQDMRNMGGLRKKIPITFWTMVCAWVAISGSAAVRRLLQQGRHSGGRLPALAGHLLDRRVHRRLTAFYVSRAMFMTFFGSYRGTAHPHESPAVMWVPLAVLAVLSLVGGWLFPHPRIPESDVPRV